MWPSFKASQKCSKGKFVQMAKLRNQTVRNRKSGPSGYLLNWCKHGTKWRFSEKRALLLKPRVSVLDRLSSAALSETNLGHLKDMIGEILRSGPVVTLPELDESEIRTECLG
jgi:hypothetical protein